MVTVPWKALLMRGSTPTMLAMIALARTRVSLRQRHHSGDLFALLSHISIAHIAVLDSMLYLSILTRLKYKSHILHLKVNSNVKVFLHKTNQSQYNSSSSTSSIIINISRQHLVSRHRTLLQSSTTYCLLVPDPSPYSSCANNVLQHPLPTRTKMARAAKAAEKSPKPMALKTLATIRKENFRDRCAWLAFKSAQRKGPYLANRPPRRPKMSSEERCQLSRENHQKKMNMIREGRMPEVPAAYQRR